MYGFAILLYHLCQWYYIFITLRFRKKKKKSKIGEYESISPLELTGLCILYRLIIFEKKNITLVKSSFSQTYRIKFIKNTVIFWKIATI